MAMTRTANADTSVTFTLTVPGTIAPQIDAAFQASYNYQATVPDPANPGKTIPNPVAPNNFAMECVKKYIQEVCTAAHVRQQTQAAAATAATQAAELASQIG